jgi:hypothetical protein
LAAVLAFAFRDALRVVLREPLGAGFFHGACRRFLRPEVVFFLVATTIPSRMRAGAEMPADCEPLERGVAARIRAPGGGPR